VPKPKEISQVSSQSFVYDGNVLFFSPYKSEKQKTNVKTPTEKIASFSTGESVVRKGNTITYGTYPPADPFAELKFHVHFENPKAALTIPTLTREFQISHWLGEISVQEDFFLRNDGARLKGQFSRLQHQQTANYHASIPIVKKLSFKFPPGAHSAYFKDDVGNVSTSNFREGKTNSVLDIRPRYPIFGGWNYTWFHGYRVPIDVLLRQVGADTYMVKIPFVENINEMTVDKAVLKVMLPEGAKDIKISTPFPVDAQSITIYHTYLSSTGHHLVTLEKFNVVREHTSPILITYTYPFWANFQKPLVTAAAIVVLFFVSMIWGRIPKSIGADKSHNRHSQHRHHKKSK
jgi:oligosaccharyltransferase complex subunit alpha (ribophorin I)